MAEQPSPQEEPPRPSVNTEGGAYIEGQVDTGGGDFVGRDQYNIGEVKNYNFYPPASFLGWRKKDHEIDPEKIKRQNRQLITIASLAGLVLLAIVLLAIFYFFSQVRFGMAMRQLNLAVEPDEQIREMVNVASMIDRWPLGSQPRQKLAAYFDHLGPEKQAELFRQADPAADLHNLIRAVYILPPQDPEEENRPVLEAMYAWLLKSEASPSTLQKELGYWLEGQELEKQGKIFLAVEKYNLAVAENQMNQNPAVLLERARAYLQIKQYNQALEDGEASLAAAYGQFPQQKTPADKAGDQQSQNGYVPIHQRFEDAFRFLLKSNGKLQAYLRIKGGESYSHIYALLADSPTSEAALEISLRWTGSDDLDLWVRLEDDTLIDTEHPQGADGGRLVNDANPGCLASSSTGGAREVIAWEQIEVPENYIIGARVAQECGDQVNEGGVPFEINVKRDGVVISSYAEKILPEQNDLVVARIGSFKPKELAVLSSGSQAAPVSAVAFSEDSHLLLIVAKSVSIYAWQDTPQPLLSIQPACNNINSYAVSSDWSSLALVCDNDTIEIWSLEAQRRVKTIKPQRSDIVQVALSDDSEHLAYAASNGEIMLIDMVSGETFPPLVGQQNAVTEMVFTPDTEFLFSGAKDQTIYRWKIDGTQQNITGGYFARTNPAPLMLVHDPISGRIVAADEAGKFTWWDENTGAIYRTVGTGDSMVQSIAYSAELQVAAMITGMPEQAVRISLMDLQTGQMISEIENKRGPARALAFSSGGNVLAIGYPNGEVVLWDTRLSGRHAATTVKEK
jgi:hypothetical protein